MSRLNNKSHSQFTIVLLEDTTKAQSVQAQRSSTVPDPLRISGNYKNVIQNINSKLANYGN
jgi:hypothetical protein